MSPEMQMPEPPQLPPNTPTPVVEEFRIEEGNPEGFPGQPGIDSEGFVPSE